MELLYQVKTERGRKKDRKNQLGKIEIFIGIRIQELAEVLSRLEGDIVASIPMPQNVKKYVEKKLRLPM